MYQHYTQYRSQQKWSRSYTYLTYVRQVENVFILTSRAETRRNLVRHTHEDRLGMLVSVPALWLIICCMMRMKHKRHLRSCGNVTQQTMAEEELVLEVSDAGLCVWMKETEYLPVNEDIMSIFSYFFPFTRLSEKNNWLLAPRFYIYHSVIFIAAITLERVFLMQVWLMPVLSPIAPGGTVKCTPFGNVAVMWWSWLWLKSFPGSGTHGILWHAMERT